jgi:hypothetical protein
VATRVAREDEATRWELVRLEYDAARILWAGDRLDEAATRSGRAAEASMALGSPGHAAESRLMQARILLDAQRAVEAQAAIHRALEVLPDGADREPYDEVLNAARSRMNSTEETP